MDKKTKTYRCARHIVSEATELKKSDKIYRQSEQRRRKEIKTLTFAENRFLTELNL